MNKQAAIDWANKAAEQYGLDPDKLAALRAEAVKIAARYQRASDQPKARTLVTRQAQKLGHQDWSNVTVMRSGRSEVML